MATRTIAESIISIRLNKRKWTPPSPSENSFQPAHGCCVHRGSCVIGTVTMIHHAGCLVSMARQGSAFCGSPSMHGMSQKAEKPFKKA